MHAVQCISFFLHKAFVLSGLEGQGCMLTSPAALPSMQAEQSTEQLTLKPEAGFWVLSGPSASSAPQGAAA